MRYWVLVEPYLGETETAPGGLLRHRVDASGSHLEILLGDGTWQDRYPAFAGVLFKGDAGALVTTQARVEELLGAWPPPSLRPGFATDG